MCRMLPSLFAARTALIVFGVLASGTSAARSDSTNAFSRSPRGAAAVVHPNDKLQVIELIGPEAADHVPWQVIRPGLSTLVSMRVVPDGIEIVRRIAAVADIRLLFGVGVRLTDNDISAIVEVCPHLGLLQLAAWDDLAADELADLTTADRARLAQGVVTSDGLARLAGLKELQTLMFHGFRWRMKDLECLSDLRTLSGLALVRMAVTDEVFEIAGRLPELKTLWLNSTEVRGSGFNALAACTKLNVLSLQDTRVTGNAVLQLGDIRTLRLRKLQLSGSKVAADEVQAIERALPFTEVQLESGGGNADDVSIDSPVPQPQALRLTRQCMKGLTYLLENDMFLMRTHPTGSNVVGVSFPKKQTVGDWVFAYLTLISSIETLDLSGTAVSNRGAAELPTFVKLSTLGLAGTALDDGAVPNICKCLALEYLDLSGTRVTDIGAEHLLELRNLKKLSLGGTRVSDSMIARLRRALPNADIDFGQMAADGGDGSQ